MGTSKKSTRAFISCFRNKFSRKSLKSWFVMVILLLPWVPVVFAFNYIASQMWSHITISPTASAGAHVFYYTGDFDRDGLKKHTWIRLPRQVPKNLVGTNCKPDCEPSREYSDVCLCNTIKKIACAEGDNLVAKNREFYCNNYPLGVSKTHSKKGVPLDSFEYEGIIPENHVFLMNEHKDSYDSRYYGLVSKNEITALVTPLF